MSKPTESNFELFELEEASEVGLAVYRHGVWFHVRRQPILNTSIFESRDVERIFAFLHGFKIARQQFEFQVPY